MVAADEVCEAELHGEEEDGEEDGLRDPEGRQHRRRAGDLWEKGGMAGMLVRQRGWGWGEGQHEDNKLGEKEKTKKKHKSTGE